MSDDTDELLNEATVARMTGLSPSTLQKLRGKGEGPPYVRPLGRRNIRYRRSDVREWIRAATA